MHPCIYCVVIVKQSHKTDLYQNAVTRRSISLERSFVNRTPHGCIFLSSRIYYICILTLHKYSQTNQHA